MRRACAYPSAGEGASEGGHPPCPRCALPPSAPRTCGRLTSSSDLSAEGRTLALLHVVEEFTREALVMRYERRIDADQTVAELEGAVAARGRAVEHIRCESGAQMTANALRERCRFSGAGRSYIEPGSPWQNPSVESFGSRVREELLSAQLFSSLAEAKVMVADWQEDYNNRRPHSSLRTMSPARFAAAWPSAQSQSLPAPNPLHTGRAAGGSGADVTIQSNKNPGLSNGVDR